jgi:hypothetical protein
MTAYILRCRLHMTCPHSVSQNGTCGGADGPDEKGRWHLEHVTNSQISRSVCEEDEIWDMPWDVAGRESVNGITGSGSSHVTETSLGYSLNAGVCRFVSSHMSPEPPLTSAGWSLNGLIMQGHRFREISRISLSDKNLDATIRKHESSGLPLVIEGVHDHQAWPAAMFDIQWLCDNLKQRELGKLVRWLSCG